MGWRLWKRRPNLWFNIRFGNIKGGSAKMWFLIFFVCFVIPQYLSNNLLHSCATLLYYYAGLDTTILLRCRDITKTKTISKGKFLMTHPLLLFLRLQVGSAIILTMKNIFFVILRYNVIKFLWSKTGGNNYLVKIWTKRKKIIFYSS